MALCLALASVITGLAPALLYTDQWRRSRSMVGYRPDKEEKLSDAQLGAAGAASGAVTRATCQPLDVLKIRFQLQLEPVRGIAAHTASSKYRGLLQATRSVVTEEGFAALWKGHVPAQGLSLVYGASQFYTFEALTRHASKHRHDVKEPAIHFICGSAAGCAASLASHPLDVVRTRLIAQGEPKIYGGTIHAFIGLVRAEGFLALYRGLLPSIILVAPQIGAVFAFYRAFSDMWEISAPELPGMHFTCGALAGVCAKTLVYPLDLAKKRLQVKGFEHARRGFGEVVEFRGLTHVMMRTVTKEGLLGLFKGLWPSLLKAAATTGLQLAVYEHACKFLRTVS